MKGIIPIILLSSACLSNHANAYPYEPLIKKYAQLYNVDHLLVRSMMRQESAFNKMALSTLSNGEVGAYGLMQLMPATAKRFGVEFKDIYKPEHNILGGIKYIAWLKNHFKGDLKLVLAGYNAGEGAVKKYGGIPPYKETQKYVKRVLNYYSEYKNKNIDVSNTKPRKVYVYKETNGSQKIYSGVDLSLVKTILYDVDKTKSINNKEKSPSYNPNEYTRIRSITSVSEKDISAVGYRRYKHGQGNRL